MAVIWSLGPSCLHLKTNDMNNKISRMLLSMVVVVLTTFSTIDIYDIASRTWTVTQLQELEARP